MAYDLMVEFWGAAYGAIINFWFSMKYGFCCLVIYRYDGITLDANFHQENLKFKRETVTKLYKIIICIIFDAIMLFFSIHFE